MPQGRVLIVDDELLNRELLGAMVEMAGHGCDYAGDGYEALEKLRMPVDLVLLDIMMPGMDGYEVLERLKADPDLRHLPVIVISAIDDLESVVRCIEMGAEDYLPKPFNPVLLKARITACLGKKRLRDQEARLFEQLQENYERLKEMEALRDDLTHMIVHDLRTPLTSVLTGLQTLELLGELHQEQKECLELAVRGGRTLLGMINDLLDISKMEDGSLQLECRELAPSDLIEQAMQQVEPLARQKELTLERDVARDGLRLVGDEEKLRRTLVNLLGNAIKFTPIGGAVTVSVRPSREGVLFAVRDTGEGIPREAFGRIFEKFGQVESRKAGRAMSTGLGLTFCKMAVEAHGGRIWVESEGTGKGSTFSFVVPAAVASPVHGRMAPEEEAVGARRAVFLLSEARS